MSVRRSTEGAGVSSARTTQMTSARSTAPMKRSGSPRPLISDGQAIDLLLNGGSAPRAAAPEHETRFVDPGYGDIVASAAAGTPARPAGSAPLQAKLEVGASGDRFEQEADRVAEAVTRPDAPQARAPLSTTPAASTVQRACAACEHDATDRGQPPRPPGTEGIAGVLTGGAPLPVATRALFESRFGHDFGDVRIHTDPATATTARALGARAYTTGRDIVFAPDQFAPGTSDGQKLLAHELTHVVQQRQRTSGVPDLQRDDNDKQKKPAPIPWKYHYKDEEQAKQKIKELTEKGIAVEGPTKDKEGYTFIVHPISEAEAAATADALAKAEPTHAVTVAHEKLFKGGPSVPYVEDVPKCPDSIPVKPPEQVWPECFKTEIAANALKAKFDKAHISATVVPVTQSAFGLRFRPLTKAEAEAAGARAARQRSIGPDDVPFKVTTSENKKLHSFTFDVQAACPPGTTDLGEFLLTTYGVVQEKDFPDGEVESAPSLPRRTFRKGFLTSTKGPFYGVKMEGSGRALNGDFINYDSKKEKFTVDSCALDSKQECLKPNVSVAVPGDISTDKKSELLIEGVGTRIPADHGEAVGSQHIDLYVGETLSASEFNKRTFPHRKVCQKNVP